MARGWESRSVEEQQAEAAAHTDNVGPRLSVAQAALQAQEANLRLARKHILQQVELARNPQHRRVLQAALADIDARLAGLSPAAE